MKIKRGVNITLPLQHVGILMWKRSGESFPFWVFVTTLGVSITFVSPQLNSLCFSCFYVYLKEIYFPGFFAFWFLGTSSHWEALEEDVRVENRFFSPGIFSLPLSAFFGFSATQRCIPSNRFSAGNPGPWALPASSFFHLLFILMMKETVAKVLKYS